MNSYKVTRLYFMSSRRFLRCFHFGLNADGLQRAKTADIRNFLTRKTKVYRSVSSLVRAFDGYSNFIEKRHLLKQRVSKPNAIFAVL